MRVLLISVFSIIVLLLIYYPTNDIRIYNGSESSVEGIDISHHNGVIKWGKVDSKTQFVIIKASQGAAFKDPKFFVNWNGVKNNNIIRGAYHFFDPCCNAKEQFSNFKNSVILRPGDLPPILDVELKECDIDEVNEWLRLAKEFYGVEPILYSEYLFFKVFMEGRVQNYKLWLFIDEKYNLKPAFNNYDCVFWQYSHKGVKNGINGNVDLNRALGSSDEFYNLLIK